MERERFTQYDEYPIGMIMYLRNYGSHFNKRLCEFAVSKMKREDPSGAMKRIEPYTKEQVEAMLRNHNVEVINGQLYDATYVANMCKADFLGSSIKDEQHLALYIRDVIDDPDGSDGQVFNRWYADMCYNGIAIDWDEMI